MTTAGSWPRGTTPASSTPACVVLHQLVEAQVERTPDAIAVVSGGEAITYDALNGRANQLARLLRRRGAGPDVLVGLCAERSIEMVVALLGVLKAGGAYVPLDPSYPQERLNFMLQESGARLLVTEARLAERFQTAASDVVCMDADRGMLASECVDNPDNDATLDNLAYVMFTSGSTGKPKGVMIPHRAICNHMLWMQGAFPLAADDRVLQRTPCSFDASVWEFYAPLMAGARLVMAPPAGRFNPAELVDTIAANGVTVLQLVPSLLRILLDEPNLERCATLRRVFCGGEALPFQLQERFFARLGADLHELVRTDRSVHRRDVLDLLARRSGARRSNRPPDREHAGLRARSRTCSPCRSGRRGAVHRRRRPGARLPRSARAHGRALRPGSRSAASPARASTRPATVPPAARRQPRVPRPRRPSGQGPRLPHRAAARSRRRCAGTRTCASRPWSRARTAPATGAWSPTCVPRDAAARPDDSLRRFLRETLPEYMVPSAFVRLDAMPLTPNGKIDRQALPAPAGGRPELSERSWRRATDAEQALAGIWAEVLGVDADRRRTTTSSSSAGTRCSRRR